MYQLTVPKVRSIIKDYFTSAQTILISTLVQDPEALAIAEQTLVGRITGGDIASLTQAQVETLLTTSRYSSEMFPIQVSRIIASGKPTQVTLGLYRGFSLPTYATSEEVFSCICVPLTWIGTSNPIVYIGGWLDTANTDKNFNLQVSWEHWTSGDTIPVTTHDVPVQTATGTAAQYKSFKIAFTIDYDVDTPDDLLVGDALAIRIRRLAASANEIAGEFVVEGAVLVYQVGSFGATSS